MIQFNKKEFLISFCLIIIFCSAISITTVAENLRFTLDGINPWNAIEGVAFIISYFARTGAVVSYALTICIFLFIWWRLYLLTIRLLKTWKKEQ